MHRYHFYYATKLITYASTETSAQSSDEVFTFSTALLGYTDHCEAGLQVAPQLREGASQTVTALSNKDRQGRAWL